MQLMCVFYLGSALSVTETGLLSQQVNKLDYVIIIIIIIINLSSSSSSSSSDLSHNVSILSDANSWNTSIGFPIRFSPDVLY